jgi:hypothetical protein
LQVREWEEDEARRKGLITCQNSGGAAARNAFLQDYLQKRAVAQHQLQQQLQ